MCYSPIYVKNKRFGISANDLSTVPVPCGQCPACLRRRTAGWVFRLLQEQKRSKSSLFITLTYDEKNVPWTDDGPTLLKSDFQLFMKTLRRNDPSKIKYYACGEYGSHTDRPHYHAVLFNADPDAVQHSWDKGHTMVLPASGGAMAYVAKYINKGKRKREGQRINEFSLMSKGLGSNYLTNSMKQWHLDDLSRSYCVNPGGDKVAMPRYYREKVFDEDQKLIQAQLIERVHALTEDKAMEKWVQRTGRPDLFHITRVLAHDQELKAIEKWQQFKRK